MGANLLPVDPVGRFLCVELLLLRLILALRSKPQKQVRRLRVELESGLLHFKAAVPDVSGDIAQAIHVRPERGPHEPAFHQHLEPGLRDGGEALAAKESEVGGGAVYRLSVSEEADHVGAIPRCRRVLHRVSRTLEVQRLQTPVPVLLKLLRERRRYLVELVVFGLIFLGLLARHRGLQLLFSVDLIVEKHVVLIVAFVLFALRFEFPKAWGRFVEAAQERLWARAAAELFGGGDGV
eukprot:1899386-Prymnesium_polylepis.1